MFAKLIDYIAAMFRNIIDDAHIFIHRRYMLRKIAKTDGASNGKCSFCRCKALENQVEEC